MKSLQKGLHAFDVPADVRKLQGIGTSRHRDELPVLAVLRVTARSGDGRGAHGLDDVADDGRDEALIVALGHHANDGLGA